MILDILARAFLGLDAQSGKADTGPENNPSRGLRTGQDGALWTRPAANPVPPFAWTVSAAGSCAPPAWAAGASVSAGKVLRTGGGLYVLYQGAGATAATGEGPTRPGSQTDNGVPCFVVPSFTGGIDFAPSGGSQPLVGPEGAALFPVPTIGTPAPRPLADPSLVYTSAAVAVQAYP